MYCSCKQNFAHNVISSEASLNSYMDFTWTTSDSWELGDQVSSPSFTSNEICDHQQFILPPRV